MTSLLAILGLGFFLGMRHATDPDHVVAVTTLVARHRSTRSAALIGAIWGVGHTLTILAVGAGIILLGWVIPARVGLSLEFSVGLMLILLGVINLRGVRTLAAPGDVSGHVHAHAHGDYVHTHGHDHSRDEHGHTAEATPLGWLDRHLGGIGLYQLARPLVVGIVHGLAGSAAVALLVLTTIHDPAWSVLYLLVFGVGTIVGMMLITMLVAVPFRYAGRNVRWLNTGLRVGSGLISVAFGLFVAWRIGIVDGLFSATPTWTPE